jgi:hypothetical protein
MNSSTALQKELLSSCAYKKQRDGARALLAGPAPANIVEHEKAQKMAGLTFEATGSGWLDYNTPRWAPLPGNSLPKVRFSTALGKRPLKP